MIQPRYRVSPSVENAGEIIVRIVSDCRPHPEGSDRIGVGIECAVYDYILVHNDICRQNSVHIFEVLPVVIYFIGKPIKLTCVANLVNLVKLAVAVNIVLIGGQVGGLICVAYRTEAVIIIVIHTQYDCIREIRGLFSVGHGRRLRGLGNTVG